jgi:hypothetical protein
VNICHASFGFMNQETGGDDSMTIIEGDNNAEEGGRILELQVAYDSEITA